MEGALTEGKKKIYSSKVLLKVLYYCFSYFLNVDG